MRIVIIVIYGNCNIWGPYPMFRMLPDRDDAGNLGPGDAQGAAGGRRGRTGGGRGGASAWQLSGSLLSLASLPLKLGPSYSHTILSLNFGCCNYSDPLTGQPMCPCCGY